MVVVLFRPLMLSSVAPELAAAEGIRPARIELLFLLAVGVATTMALPVVGALLVFSLMIGPPATARFVTDRPARAMALSGALGLVTVWVSITASFWSNWPIGFFVGTFAVVWYVIGRCLARGAENRARCGRWSLPEQGRGRVDMVNEALHGLVEQRLRRISQRYTNGRREVVELLADAGHPVSIEDIAERAPRLPRSSAYRHLVDLQQAGVVRRVSANDDYFRFELAEDITEHHHHLLCTRCGKVLDVTPTPAFEQAMSQYLDRLATVNGFIGLDHRLDVLGACSDCQDRAPGPGSRLASAVAAGQRDG